MCLDVSVSPHTRRISRRANERRAIAGADARRIIMAVVRFLRWRRDASILLFNPTNTVIIPHAIVGRLLRYWF